MYGSGLIKGMGVTFKHFVESYVEDLKYAFKGGRYNDKYIPARQGPKAKGIFTVQYPEEKLPVPENFRFIPFLIYEPVVDEATGKPKVDPATGKEVIGVERCTACGICAKVCPPQCIWIVRATTPEGKPRPKS